jgi:hypothetical protein
MRVYVTFSEILSRYYIYNFATGTLLMDMFSLSEVQAYCKRNKYQRIGTVSYE